ncbi:MAG: FAD:protein FMN transferase [Tenuifilaceae bacterium]
MKSNYLIISILSLFLFACNSNKKSMVRYTGYTQGTTFSIKFYSNSDSTKLKHGIDSILYEINRTASTYDSTSIISKVNRNLEVELNYDFVYLFNKSQEVSENTNGCFDITVGELVRRWGFGFKNSSFPTDEEINTLLKFVGYKKVTLKNNRIIKEVSEIHLDFNAIAQGYTVDLVANYLLKNSCTNFIVEIGGEVRANGTKDNEQPWIVGIEKPAENDTDNRVIQEKIILNNKSISTSGNYRKFFIKDGQKYSHTIDPKTGYPVHHSLLSVSIKSDDCTFADAYCTAFMVMGIDKAKEFLIQHPEIEAYFIYTDSTNINKVYYTDGFLN